MEKWRGRGRESGGKMGSRVSEGRDRGMKEKEEKKTGGQERQEGRREKEKILVG